MSAVPGKPSRWWQDLLDVVPRFHVVESSFAPRQRALIVKWLGGVYVVRRLK